MEKIDVPLGGRIRPGTKMLTQAAASNPKIREMCDAGRAQKKPWSQIEKEIRGAIPDCGKRIFSPVNTPFFRVERADFDNPDTAVRIMKLYGDPDRNGEALFTDGPVAYRLYRFPAVFYAEREQILTHDLACYTAGGLKYWAETENNIRVCKQYAPPTKTQGAKRVVRHYGGRPVVLRPENDGRCVPANCPEYQARQCTEAWEILFYIYGVDDIRPLKMVSRGYYGMKDVENVLKQVEMVRGSITGLHNGKPLFYFAKKQMEVVMLDPEDGQPKRVKQWEITLEAQIDSCALLDRQRQALSRGDQAVALLAAPVSE
ncbi:MAG: recombination directionality factor [Acidiferrobacter sp.]